MALVERIRPLFVDRDPQVVSGVLADLLALLIAGHTERTPAKTKELRDGVLKIHLAAVRKLIPVNDEMLQTRAMKARDDAQASQH